MNTKIKNLSNAGVLAILVGLLASCESAPKIGFEANQQTDLTGLKTYGVLPLPQGVEGADPGAGLRLAKPLTEEIKAGMASKGYTETTVERADIVLNVRGKVVGKTDVTNWGYSYAGYGRWGGFYDPYGGIDVDQYNEGTLTIEAFHAKTKSLVWVGWAEARLSSQPDEAKFRAAVSEIVGRFPYAAGTTPPPAPAK